MQVGFAAVARRGGVEFRFFGPEGPRRALISFAQAPGLAVALMGRLHYREERAAGLPGPAPDGDAALALAVYRRFGEEGLSRLEGDFALVVWDAGAGRLIGMRDPLGGYPLFFTGADGPAALATGLAPLLPLLPGRTLDPEYLADYLMLPGCTYNEVDTDRSAYAGIRRVRPGCLVCLGV